MTRKPCPTCGREIVANVQTDRTGFYWHLRPHKPCGVGQRLYFDPDHEWT